MKTYKELMDEKARLEVLLVAKRSMIKEDVHALKEQFVPITHAFATIVQFFSRDKHNPLINAGVNFAGDVILKRFVLGRAGWLTKTVVPYIVKNYSSHLIQKDINKNNGSNFLQRFGERLKKGANSSAAQQPL
jgi:hypothetical protein